MRPAERLAVALVTAVVVVTAGLWLVLEFAVGKDLATAATVAGAVSAALVGAAGLAVAVLSWNPRGSSTIRIRPDAGFGRVPERFADRVDDLSAIKAAVNGAIGGARAGVVINIHGTPGIGKSAFAVHAANKILPELRAHARRKRLEVVSCQILLHGHEGLSRTDPRDVLHHVLQLNGLDPGRAKMGLDALSDEWRTYLRSKLAVLVIDNADDEAQVEPFLPVDSPHVVLVTSRRDLTGRGAKTYPLGALPEEGATQMIEGIVDRPLGGGERAAAIELSRLCDYNPLAIKLAVSPLVGKNDASLAGRLDEFRKSANRLLVIDEYANSRGRGVAWSFGLSYDQLTTEAQLTLRRLALAPFSVVGLEAAASLAGQPGDVVRVSLRELAAEALLEERSRDRAIYEMHDLTREYARILSSRDDATDSQAAVHRLLAYYWAAAEFADVQFTRQRPPAAVAPPASSVSHGLSDLPSVTSWLGEELANLLACADYAVQQAERGDDAEDTAWAVRFSSALAGILRNEGQWRRSIDLQTHAIDCAEKIGVPLGMANALAERGLLHRLAAELKEAEEDLEQAMAIYRRVGGPAGQVGLANALNTLGVVLDQRERPDEGRRTLSEALHIYRSLGNEVGEANVLHDQGITELFAGNHVGAIGLIGQALALYRRQGQPLGMAHASAYLARAQRAIGDDQAASVNLEFARMRYDELGNKLGVINALVQLSAVLRGSDGAEAERTLNEVVELSAQIGNQMTRMAALEELGEIHLESGDRASARAAWSRGLRVAREHGVRREETKFAAKLRQVR